MPVLIRTTIFTIAIGLFISACGEQRPTNRVVNSPPAPKGTPVPSATVDELASGKKVYETNCTICHKSDGTGGKVTIEDKSLNVEDLTSAKIKAFSDEKIIGYIMNGVPDEGMPAFKGKLSEGEIRDLVKFIRKEFHKQ